MFKAAIVPLYANLLLLRSQAPAEPSVLGLVAAGVTMIIASQLRRQRSSD